MDILEIAARANAFWPTLDKLKTELRPKDFSFYPYESLGTFDHLPEMLQNERGHLIDLAAGAPILDLGAGDGDVSFFLESLGCKVVAVDNPATNWNGMGGMRLLKDALNSSVEIETVDLDSQFTLGGRGYGLALFLGVLYHVQNPFYVMAKLARDARYCLLSTRVARYTVDRRVNFQAEPMAYLVDEHETNNDPTNYWIFSEAGLKRLFTRTNWTVCDFMTVGNRTNSDPVTAEGDERAYVLLKSDVFHGSAQLLSGWHQPESDGWRWVEREFSAEFPRRSAGARSVLRLKLAVPELLTERLGAVTLRARVNGVDLPPDTYAKAGRYEFARRVPAAAMVGETLRVDFAVDRAMPGDESDLRERGLIAVSLDLE